MKTRLLKSLSTIILGILICHTHLFGQTTTNLNPIKDNSIYSESDNSNGTGELFSGKTGLNNGNALRRALIKFDLTSIPSGATITSVTLTVNVNKVSPGSGTENYKIYGLTKDFGEGTSFSAQGIGASAVAPDATWNYAMFNTVNWTVSGGDFEAGSLASLNLTGTGSYTFLSTTNLINLAQSWLDSPASNNGLILIGDESKSNTARQFGSKDVGVAPILSVTWDPPLSTEDFSISNFTMFPNPSNSMLHLKFPQYIAMGNVMVYDVLGKALVTETFEDTDSVELNVSNLVQGIYFVRVKSGTAFRTKQFIKN